LLRKRWGTEKGNAYPKLVVEEEMGNGKGKCVPEVSVKGGYG
jgi:hypothetical protein